MKGNSVVFWNAPVIQGSCTTIGIALFSSAFRNRQRSNRNQRIRYNYLVKPACIVSSTL